MPIYDQSYAHWEGRLEGRLFRWLPITLNAVRLAFRSKIFLVVFCLALAPFIVRIGMIYIFNLVPQAAGDMELRRMATVDASFYNNFLVRDQFVSIVLMCLFVGCGLIAKDLKVRALEIYFSKPITLFDYLAGKFAVMVFFLFCMTLFPGILLFVSDFLLSGPGSVSGEIRLLAGVFGVSLLVTVVVSSIVFAASALCRSARNAALLWIGFHLALMISGQILSHLFNMRFLELIDVKPALRCLARVIMGMGNDYDLPWIFVALYLGLLCGGAALIVFHRVKRVEVGEE